MKLSVATLAAGLLSMGMLLYWCCLAGFRGGAPPPVSMSSTSPTTQYVVMIDAGSSGSRVHVYKYTYREGSVLPEFELPSKTLKLTPGLSSFDKDPAAAGSSLTGLLEFAQSHIPAAHRSATPLYLYAYDGF